MRDEAVLGEPRDGTRVSLDRVNIAYGEKLAVADVNLSIAEGSFFTLLGPSGCGKTTLLRTIAGFIRQTSGEIRFGKQVMDDVPAHRRDAGMVFQNYAIFPHLTVEENVAYGLKARRMQASEMRKRVNDALEMVDLIGYEKRLPKALSGGQQQRVVIARAIAIRPRVLLMDEPLANLDAKLRVRLRNDLKALQRELAITTIYVTHDQEEALSLSDRLAVMSNGAVEQVGTPREVFREPSSVGVANFIGEANFHRAELSGGGTRIRFADGQTLAVANSMGTQRDVWVGFRPQEADIVGIERDAGGNGLTGTVTASTFLGSDVQIRVLIATDIEVMVQARERDLTKVPEIGDQVGIAVRPEDMLVFPYEVGQGQA